MTTMSEAPVREMTLDDCWARLADNTFGRIATAAVGEVSITPFNYVTDGRTLVFRTAPGTKLADLVVDSNVAVEIDEVTGDEAWSVIARGTARLVEATEEIERLASLSLHPWVATDKQVWVVIDIDEVTGRAFTLSR